MRYAGFILLLIVAGIFALGSRGSFTEYNAKRAITVPVGRNAYIEFECNNTIIRVINNMDVPISAKVVASCSPELNCHWEEATILPGESKELKGTVTGLPGTYQIPLTIIARWNGGDAKITACRIEVTIEKGDDYER
ncbi:hypothetical protein [Pyrococcus yayanosii]|uniref:DUF1573 domain-containing protein n=1 Tax=Pyrococcus yayanosii (strain CH1 / JCM 16557) TaxID=529709 RepID=F8AF79_PYRYC|nr:hypothetical protein [Pyrococcus yayanosii]AEH24907.1 hypothetical protein PYCH_12290 [Pyrococcus yayanosii CH1]